MLFQYRDVPKLFDFNTTIIPYSQTFFSSSNLIVYYKYRIIIEFSKQLFQTTFCPRFFVELILYYLSIPYSLKFCNSFFHVYYKCLSFIVKIAENYCFILVPQEKEPHVMKRKRKRNELKPEIVAVLHTVKNYNIIEPPLCETRKQDRSDKRIFG